MAKGKKTGGKDFTAGQAGGPGRPILPIDIKQARELNKESLERLLNRYIYMTPGEIGASLSNANTPYIDRIVAQILMQAAEKGDHQRLDFILTRLVGKVKEQVEVTGTTSHFIISRPDGSKVEMGTRSGNNLARSLIDVEPQ